MKKESLNSIFFIMDSKDASTTPAVARKGPKPLQSSSPRTQYLILYNFASAILWLAVLGRVVLLVPMVGFGSVYRGVGEFTKWTQTMALLEVVHALTGSSPSMCCLHKLGASNANFYN